MLPSCGKGIGSRSCYDYIGVKLNQVFRSFWQVAGGLGKSADDVEVAPLDVSEFSQPIKKISAQLHAFKLSWRALSKRSNHRAFLRLGRSHTRPRRRTAEHCEELAAL
jgi:hypothetical protein